MVHEGVIRRSAAALSDTTLTGTSAAVTKLIAAVSMMAKLMSAVLRFCGCVLNCILAGGPDALPMPVLMNPVCFAR